MITCFSDSESEETWTRRAESHIRSRFRSTGDGGDWKVYTTAERGRKDID